MINKKLYESLCQCIYESRIQRTIDKKLWLSIASTCSRNKETQAENIKPSVNATKEQLLPRYVAALLIMKKACPTTEQEMDEIKTFKLVGKKLLQLGCTFEEIQNEYVANGGKIITKEVNVDPKQVEQKLDQDIKQPIEKQVQKQKFAPTNTTSKNVEPLPEGIKSFNDLLLYVQDNYDSMIKVAQAIYDILDQTYYTIQSTFYKLQRPDGKLYFKGVTTDERKKIFHNDEHVISIDWVKTKKSKVFTGTFCITANDLSINGEKIAGKDVKLDNSTYITFNELCELLNIILAKLLFRQQGEYVYPEHQKPKTRFDTLGKFGNKRRSFYDPVDAKELLKIFNMLHRKCPNYRSALNIIDTMLQEGYGTGKNEFIVYESLYDISTTDGIYELRGFKDNGILLVNSKKQTFKICHTWRIATANPNNMIEISWQSGIEARCKDLQECVFIILANILYFANNYSNLMTSNHIKL